MTTTFITSVTLIKRNNLGIAIEYVSYRPGYGLYYSTEDMRNSGGDFIKNEMMTKSQANSKMLEMLKSGEYTVAKSISPYSKEIQKTIAETGQIWKKDFSSRLYNYYWTIAA